MQIQPTVTFRHLPPSPALEKEVRRRIADLGSAFERVLACHVVVDLPHLHQQRRRRYDVRVELSVPGGQLVVARSGDDPVHADAYLAVRDAFRAARRQLDEYFRRRAAAKTEELPAFPL